MRSLLVLFAILAQFGPRPPLRPAETLLDPRILGAIADGLLGSGDPGAPPLAVPLKTIEGTDPNAGEIVLTCDKECDAATLTEQKLRLLIGRKWLPQPSRSIRVVPAGSTPPSNVKAAIHLMPARNLSTLTIIRGLWSTAGIGDEVVEVFARHGNLVAAVQEFSGTFSGTSHLGNGIATTSIFYNERDANRATFVAAASTYFLATLPNAGAEALLSHLTVGAHARLAEDGRKAVAQMGSQQRASADVLIMFGQAIEREQRRIRSFENYMPTPVDPALHSRILEMEKGITSVWTSMGITSSPFVPAAQRIRGRGGEDRRIVTRVGTGPLPTPEPPTALLKFQNSDVVIYELGNFIDGKRSISDIRDAVSAEFGPIALPVVVDYFERLAKTGAVAIR